MKKNQEPEQLASIAISRDEIAGHHRPTGKMRPIAAEHSTAPKLLWALTAFAIILSIALLVQLQQVQSQSDKQLKALSILQERLSSTDEQSNLSVDAIKILLKEQDHEIRKLWDVTNKRNKGRITKNTERLDDQNKLLTQYASKVEQLGKSSESLTLSIDEKFMISEKTLNSKVSSLQTSLKGVEVKVNKAVASIPSNISKTLTEHGKGINAMDKTRLQLLNKIKSLEKKVAELSKPVVTVH